MRNNKNHTDTEWTEICKQDRECVRDIKRLLWKKGYEVCSEQDIINAISQHSIDMADVKLPYACDNVEEWQSLINERESFLSASKKEFDNSNHTNRTL